MADGRIVRIVKTALVLAAVFFVGVVAGGLIKSRFNPDSFTWLLIAVLLVGGLIGGCVNYLMSQADDPHRSLAKSIVVGTGASLLVPLFLNMLSSDLHRRIREDPYSMLIFLGFSLVAAISSKAFITTISDRLLSEVREAKETAAAANEKANAAVESQSEPAPETTPRRASTAKTAAKRVAVKRVDDDEVKVLRALNNPKYKFRFMFGVVHDSGIEPDRVSEVLADLEERALVANTEDKESRTLYYLTSEGKAAVERLESG